MLFCILDHTTDAYSVFMSELVLLHGLEHGRCTIRVDLDLVVYCCLLPGLELSTFVVR